MPKPDGGALSPFPCNVLLWVKSYWPGSYWTRFSSALAAHHVHDSAHSHFGELAHHLFHFSELLKKAVHFFDRSP